MQKQEKKLKNILIKCKKQYSPHQYFSPYEFLNSLNNEAIKFYDIKFVQAKFIIKKNEQHVKLDKQNVSLKVDQNYNRVFDTGIAQLDEIFGGAEILQKPADYDPQKYEKEIEENTEIEKNQQCKKLDNCINLIMRVYEGAQGVQKLVAIQKFEKQVRTSIKNSEVRIQAKAIANTVVFEKVKQNQNNNRPIVLKSGINNLNLYLHPLPGEKSINIIEDKFRISQWKLGCQYGDIKTKQQYNYFSSMKLQLNAQNYNNSIKIVNSISFKTFNDLIQIKSFTIQCKTFNQIIFKFQVDAKQIRKFQKYQSNKEIIYYFHCNYPPKYYALILNEEAGTVEEFIKGWHRIENFPFLRDKYINKNDILRLYLFNNTIVQVRLQKDSFEFISHGKNIINKLDNFIESFQSKQGKGLIDYQRLLKKRQFLKQIKILNSEINYEKSFVQKFKYMKYHQADNVWQLKYLLLIILRYNLIRPLQINKILKDVQENIQDILIYINILWNRVTHISNFRLETKDFFQEIKNQYIELKKLNINQRKVKVNSNIVYIYKGAITPSGIIYDPPTPEMKGRLLKEFTHQSDFFFRMAIRDDDQQPVRNQRYITTIPFRKRMDKMTIVNRNYIALGWSPSQLRAFSIWYISEISEDYGKIRRMSREMILNFLGNFKDIFNPAKKAARIGQSFSASWTYICSQIKEKLIEDKVSKKGFLYTDGIGKISEDLIEKISLNLHIQNLSIIQIRYKGSKGILVVDPTLPPSTIQLRQSMKKYECEHQSAKKYLDILDWNKYKLGYLNRQIIILLSTLGIKDEIFQKLQQDHIKSIEQMSYKDCSVFKHMYDDYNNDINNVEPARQIIIQLLKTGFELDQEPFFRGVLQTLKKNGYHQLKSKSSIKIDQSVRIIGIIDQYGILNENEVYCTIFSPFDKKPQRKVIQGDVIITRNPCLNPADIRKLFCPKQIDIQQRFKNIGMENIFQNLLNCIIFPMKGDIPITAQISGSDLDGDNFFICWDSRLIINKQDEPEVIDQPPNSKNPSKDQNEVGYQEMLDFFVKYLNYDNLGHIDNSHLVHADKDNHSKARNQKCIQLAKIHGKAVDFPKTGYCPPYEKRLLCQEFPDFMEKDDQLYVRYAQYSKLYRSTKEKITQIVDNPVSLAKCKYDVDLMRGCQLPFSQNDITEAVGILKAYDRDLSNIILLSGVQTQFEIYSGIYSIKKVTFHLFVIQLRAMGRIASYHHKYFNIFFDDSLRQQNEIYENVTNIQVCTDRLFNQQVYNKALLYYLISYLHVFPQIKYEHEKWEDFKKVAKDKFGQKSKGSYCGFIWFVIPKVIINLKKTNAMHLLNKIKEQEQQQQLQI